jgi:hypothetical protein
MTSATITAPASLEQLAIALKEKRCIVVGAAPIQTLFSVSPGDVVVAVNGGISSCPPGPVDVWVVNSRSGAWQSWGAERLRLANLMLAQARGRHVRLIVFLAREDEAPAVTTTHLRAQGTTWDDAIALVQTERHELEQLAGARTPDMTAHALSAGMTAAAICFAAGAAHVRLVGFSWSAGYQYAPGDRAVTTRGHEGGDRQALPLLDARYGTRFEHSEFSLPDRDRSMSTVQKVVEKAIDKALTKAQSPTPQTNPPKPEPGFKVRVKPGHTVWYGNQRWRENAVFMLRNGRHFKAKAMERVAESAKVTRVRASDVGRQRDMELAQQVSGGRVRVQTLKPNAVDLVDTQGAGDVELADPRDDAAID